MKLNRKHPTEKPKSILEEQVRKDATHQQCGKFSRVLRKSNCRRHKQIAWLGY
jgi:hypothetical protein